MGFVIVKVVADIMFVCPECEGPLVVAEEGAGITVPCGHCGMVIQIPIVYPAPSAQYLLSGSPPLPAIDEAQYAEKVRKGLGSNLSKLDSVSILRKTKAGETPVHRAARQRRLSEIRRELLSKEHFMIQNNEGRTALHLAASNSCLDQVPPEFLDEDTLSVADCYGTSVIHEAAQYGTINQIPRSALTRQIMNLKNKRGDTVSDLIEQNRPTQKQLDYLKSLAVPFDLSVLTKARASGLIDSALREQRSKEAPSDKQLAMVQRLGLVSELEQGASKQDVTDLLDHATVQPATAAQIQRAESLGLILNVRDEFTVGDLDKFLKLADRRPSPEDEADLSRLSITSFERTALGARMLLALAMIYESEFVGMDDDESSVARACIAAAKDNDFARATIRQAVILLQTGKSSGGRRRS